MEPPTTAQVVELDETGKPQWRPLLGLPKHALTEKPITQPLRSRILIVLDLVLSWESWHDADAEVNGRRNFIAWLGSELRIATDNMKEMVTHASGVEWTRIDPFSRECIFYLFQRNTT